MKSRKHNFKISREIKRLETRPLNYYLKSLVLTVAMVPVALTVACQPLQGTAYNAPKWLNLPTITPAQDEQVAEIRPKNNMPKWLTFAKTGQQHLNNREYLLASDLFNKALKLNVKNADLQALNGIAYHLSSRLLDSADLTLAEQGYRLSSKFSPANWIPHYLQGLVKLDKRNFNGAKKEFVKAAIRNWPNNDILIKLLIASFYDLDFELSSKLINYLRHQNLNLTINEKKQLYKTCSLIYAAVNNISKKKKCLSDYLILNPSKNEYVNLEKMLSIWPSLQKIATTPFVQAQTDSTTLESLSKKEPETTSESDDVISDDRMVVVDVVIIGTRENIRKTKGINLLDGLAIQFGDVTNSLAAVSRTFTDTNDFDDSDNDSSVKVFAKALTLPAIEYSFNIFNDLESHSKILAKPSLIALSNQTSVFFSGTGVTAASTSGAGESVTIEQEVGVKLSVTPQFISSKKVLLQVTAERTFLTDPDVNVQFEFRFDVTKTTIDSTVVMDIGDTLMLGGLTEQESTISADGVPFLQDLPLVKYLFSEQGDQKFSKSITILLTPRSTSQDEASQNMKSSKVNAFSTMPEFKLLTKLLGISEIITDEEKQAYNKIKYFISDQFVEPDEIMKSDNQEHLIQLGNEIMNKYFEI